MRRQRLGPLPDAATVAATDVEADAFAASDAATVAATDVEADAAADAHADGFAAPDVEADAFAASDAATVASPDAHSDRLDYRLRHDRQQNLHGEKCVAREPGRRRGDVRPHLDVGHIGGDEHAIFVLRE